MKIHFSKQPSPFWIRSIITAVMSSLLIGSSMAQTIKRLDHYTWNNINNQVYSTYATNQLKGISVAVVYGGQVAYANAFGNKNDDGDPFTIYTKSLLASISKTITGVLAMRLVENGDMALNDFVAQYISGFNNTGITIRHLLSHQSGIGHYPDCPGGYSGPFNAGDSREVIEDCSICFTPAGSSQIYTTFGNTLLGCIISSVGFEVYGMGYQGLYQTWMRGPGGLGTLEPAYDNSDPDLAEGDLGESSWDDIGWKLPAGGFISDIIDLADFTRGLLNNVFISQATFDLMKIDQTTSGTPDFDCASEDSDDYGLAFRTSSGNPAATNFFIWHNGLNDHGYSSYMIVYPNRNASIVMLTNTSGATGALNTLRQNIQDYVLCPQIRDFTNDISWTEPRIFEGENITGQSAITSSNTNEYIFDAENYVRLRPGFHAPAGKVFRATVEDGCAGTIVTD